MEKNGTYVVKEPRPPPLGAPLMGQFPRWAPPRPKPASGRPRKFPRVAPKLRGAPAGIPKFAGIPGKPAGFGKALVFVLVVLGGLLLKF
ncbi:hypothetical protein E2C01_021064 [Portunus trituberculatus]|uniref:Uncharacterized protein n=1 Tax=Portunus trituberculatus TaxID=210409 RepID=A0A5B7E3D9_PORTR|nr:hypothetical protein [Portunus trituberculatus]